MHANSTWPTNADNQKLAEFLFDAIEHFENGVAEKEEDKQSEHFQKAANIFGKYLRGCPVAKGYIKHLRQQFPQLYINRPLGSLSNRIIDYHEEQDKADNYYNASIDYPNLLNKNYNELKIACDFQNGPKLYLVGKIFKDKAHKEKNPALAQYQRALAELYFNYAISRNDPRGYLGLAKLNFKHVYKRLDQTKAKIVELLQLSSNAGQDEGTACNNIRQYIQEDTELTLSEKEKNILINYFIPAGARFGNKTCQIELSKEIKPTDEKFSNNYNLFWLRQVAEQDHLEPFQV